MRANGESLKSGARIKLSTIHSVKGGEEDNVIILPDLTYNTQQAYERNKDDENRLFYVGATRTKEHLHIVRPKDENKAFPMGDVWKIPGLKNPEKEQEKNGDKVRGVKHGIKLTFNDQKLKREDMNIILND